MTMTGKSFFRFRRVLVGVVCASLWLTLAGCSRNTPTPAPVAAPAASPTAPASPTALPSPTSTATASATATPTATTTPTPVPSARLLEAQHLQLNGDTTAARTLFAAIAKDNPASQDGLEAAWRLGQSYWEEGELNEAFVVLNGLRQDAPADALPAEVDFWLGDTLAQLGNAADAITAYRAYLARDDALAGLINLRVGRLLVAEGDTAAALTALQAAVDTATDNFVLFAAREELATLHEQAGDLDAALAELDQILAVSQLARYRAELQHRAGTLLDGAGQTAAALERFRAAVQEDEKSTGALLAVDMLDAAAQPVDAVTRARVQLGNGYVASGVNTLQTYFAATPDHPADLHLLIAEAWFGQREYEQALAAWQTLLDSFPAYTDRAGVLIRMAVAHTRLGNTATARDLYAQAATASDAQAAAARLEAARLAERSGDCRTAATEYLDLARLYPADPAAGEALYRGGLCQYRLGQTASAVTSWQRLLADAPAHTYAHAARFWAGKGLLEQGDAAQAVSLWRELKAEADDSYYTARAYQLATAANLPDAVSLAPHSALPDDDGSQAAAQRWLAGWAAPAGTDPAALAALPEAVAADAQLRRGEAYLAAGLRTETLREMDAVARRYTDDPLASYALALHFRDLRLYRHATVAALRVAVLSPDGALAAPLFLQRMIYPTYYADLVEAEAAAQGMDAALLFALIRQESTFEQGARSSAAAQGLMQVIPDTATWIAQQIGWPDFVAADIYKPYVNVKFGTYYLRAALAMFDGDAYPALVGYNAGPGNARAWLDSAATTDDDLYVEEITISEPRIYVRRVLANYAAYQRLYPATEP